MSIIEFKDVTKKYRKTIALDKVSLSIPKGEIVVIVGSSGSGKTTLLKMINLLIKPSSGAIFFDGENNQNLNIEDLRKQIGYVGQTGGLFPHRTVYQNIETTPKLLGWEKDDIEHQIKKLMRDVNLEYETYKDRFPRELSGGQKQRVSIARAMAANPPVLLMDEPFTALDPIIRLKLQDDILRLHYNSDTTIVFVTHDMDEAFRIGDKIIYVEKGKIVQQGTPISFIECPKNEDVETLLSFLSAKTIENIKEKDHV